MDPFECLQSIRAKPYELALDVPVLLDMKPASKMCLSGDDEDTEKVAKKLRSLGLQTLVKKSDGFPRADSIFVSKSAEILHRLSTLEIDDRYNEGLLYGYPKTAVDAFIRKDLLPEEDCPLDEFIIPFRLSKKHWEDELKVMRQWNNAVKQYTPKIYKAFMDEN